MAYIMDTNEEERVKVWIILLIKLNWFFPIDGGFAF